MGDALHILDIFSDINFAKMMYEFSRVEISDNNGLLKHDYNTCFVWTAMTILGPSIIQFSTRMNILYHKGIFED